MIGQIDEKLLEAMLKESLEKDIINFLSERTGVTQRMAMDVFYRTELSSQIDSGIYGIQYLDAKYLVDDLLENEKSLINSLYSRSLSSRLKSPLE